MRSESPQKRHERTVEELAADYTRRGYAVTPQPGIEDTPEFLRPYVPDLIAIKGEERWIVDVKTPGFTRDHSNEERGAWSRLAQHVRQAGWHFQLVTTKSDADDLRSYAIPEASEIETGLADPEKLAGQGQAGAALMVAWSLFEAAAGRRLLLDDEDPRRPETPVGLAKVLVSLGHVEESEYEALRDIARLRNQVAHGIFNASVSADRIALLATLTRRLLVSEPEPADGDARAAKVA
jgi:hypothetical protein